MVFKKKVEGDKEDTPETKQVTPEAIIKGLENQVEEDAKENEKQQHELDLTREDLEKVLGKQKKDEEYTKTVTNDLKESKSLVRALRTEMVKDTPKVPIVHGTPEPMPPSESGETPDALCAICKTKFSSAATLIKDKESRTYLSIKCPQCGKIQNAESAQARFIQGK